MADVQEGLDLRRRARRRLIGAIALVLALVIVPPWLMDLEPRPVTSKLSVEIPSQDAGKLKPPPKPPATETAPKPADVTKSSDAARTPPTVSTGASGTRSLDSRTVAALGAPTTAEAPDPEAPKPVEEKPKPTTKAMEPTRRAGETARAEAALSGGTESFVVPLGSFGNAENAKQLQARLAKEGIQTYAEPIRTASGEQTRVRAGPYPSRDAAEKVRDRVKGMGIDAGNVVARQ